jgi:hypothetical protein
VTVPMATLYSSLLKSIATFTSASFLLNVSRQWFGRQW